MTTLVIGLLLFIGVHLLREFKQRDAAIQRLGENTYKLLFSGFAVVGLGLIIWGKSIAPFVMVYQPVYEQRNISHIAMLPAFILVVAGNLPMSYLRLNTLHPMLLGTVIWGGAHLWANGDLASLLLFGSLMLWAMIKYISLVKAKPLPSQTPSLMWDAIAVIAGFSIYGVVTVYHGQLFGIGLSFA